MSMSATEAVTSRRSIRAFTDQAVDEDVLRRILTDAARAPSGTNIQPWQVTVVQGEARANLVDEVQAMFDSGETTGQDSYYPAEFIEPYVSRRRKIGWDLYGILGIERGQWEKTKAQHRKNYEFFGAPVGLLFSLDRTMRNGGWLDVGLYMANVMALAREAGLDTCPQAAWLEYSGTVEAHLGWGEDRSLVCGMALGYADASDVVNDLRTERAPLDDFVDFRE